MKLLFLYYTHKPGGMCKRLYRLQNALSNSGHAVYYLCLDKPPPGSIKEKAIWIRIPFPISSRKGLLFWGIFTLWLPYYTLYAAIKIKPDRIIAFGSYYSAASILAARLKKIPVILFVRSLVFKIDQINKKPHWLRKITGIVEKIGYSTATKVVFITNSMKDEIERFICSKVKVSVILLNEVSKLTIRESEPKLPLRILLAGVIDQRKNIPFVLNALALIPKEELHNFQVTIAGDGPQLNYCIKLAQDLELSNVSFAGWQDDITEYINKSDLFLHPSLHEGLSNAVLEALSIGVPILLSDIPEHKEIAHDKINLFSLENPKILADIMMGLLNKDNYINLSESSHLVAQKLYFDWDKAAVDIASSRL